MSAVATQAAEIFDALLALDTHRAERDELRRAGVSASIVDKLYPGGFIALETPLIAHLTAVPDECFVSEGAGIFEQSSAIWEVLPQVLADDSDADSDADDALASSGAIEQTLFDYLSSRTDLSPVIHAHMRTQVVNDSYLFGLHIAQAVWAAHWLMTHRAEVPASSQAAVDELMLAVGRTINL